MKKHWPTLSEGLSLEDAIRFAESYPFPSPDQSFVVDCGTMREVRVDDLKGRTPVAASGSNAAPEQLLRKFGEDDIIVATMAWFDDLVIAYAALIAPYGSVPVSFLPLDGVRTRTVINWLTDQQLDRMDESEGAPFHYGRVPMTGTVTCEVAGPVETVWYYQASDGYLLLDDQLVTPDARITHHWDGPSLSQAAVLRKIHKLLAPRQTFDAFMRDILSDHALRQQHQQRLPRKVPAGLSDT